MSAETSMSKKRFVGKACAVFLFTLLVAPWFALFHASTQFCTSALFTSRLPCWDSLAQMTRLFSDPAIGISFVYVYFGIASFGLAVALAAYCYFRKYVGWGFPILILIMAAAKKGLEVSKLLWRADIENTFHAVYVFGTALLDVLYAALLATLFWLLMRAVIYGFKNDPHHA